MKLDTKLMLLTLAAGATLLAGCANTQRSNLYILYPVQTESKSVTASDKLKNSIVAVGKVSLPDYLERPLVITQVNQHELVYSEFRRWAGSLRENIRHVVNINIAKTLGSNKIVDSKLIYGSDTDYIVDITVLEMNGTLGKTASLGVRWRIYQENHEKEAIIHTDHFSVELKEPGYDAYVIAQSRMFAELSNKISKTLTEIVK
jgi:uncharacterized lipoprotein YmbA